MRLPFTVAVSGAAVYAFMTVGSTIVLGHVTDRVLVPAFQNGVRPSLIVWGVVRQYRARRANRSSGGSLE